jgi:hypothetical protein
MPDDVTPERVAVMAAAARVPLTAESCARVARAAGPTAARFAATNLALAFEVEPSTYTAIARREIEP